MFFCFQSVFSRNIFLAASAGDAPASNIWTIVYVALGLLLVIGSFIFIATAQMTSDWCKNRHRKQREREAQQQGDLSGEMYDMNEGQEQEEEGAESSGH